MHANRWLAALLLWPVVGQADSTFPQTVDLNLLFPRNETYAPSTGLFPVVFSMNNTNMAGPMQPLFRYSLYNQTEWELSENRTPEPLDTWSSLELTTANFTSSDPFFWVAWEGLTGEGTWRIEYDVQAIICHVHLVHPLLNITRPPDHLANSDSGHVIFTTQNNAEAIDLVAGTASRSCLDVPYSRTFNVSGLLNVSDASTSRQDSTCPEVNFSSVTDNPAEPTSTATTCGIAINSATATSLMAAMTSGACAIRHPNPSYCTNADTSSSESAACRILSVSVVSLPMAALGVLALTALL